MDTVFISASRTRGKIERTATPMWLSQRAIAKHFDVSENTVKLWDCPRLAIGRARSGSGVRWRYNVRAVEAWLEERAENGKKTLTNESSVNYGNDSRSSLNASSHSKEKKSMDIEIIPEKKRSFPITCAVDFETDFGKEYSVADVGNYDYVHDSRFNAYLGAVVELRPDGTLGREWVGTPEEIPWMEFNGALMVAHNAAFDKAVFGRLQELGIIPSECKVEWACTADMAAYFNAPRSLKGAAQVLLGEDVDKEVREEMCGVTWAEAQKRGWGGKLREYVRRDAEICGRLWQKHSGEWPEKERLVSALNRRMAEGGVRVDMERLDEAIAEVGSRLVDTVLQIPWGEEEAIGSVKAYNRQCMLEGIAVPPCRDKKDPQFQAFLAENGEEHPWIWAVLDYKSLDTLGKKLKTLSERTRPDGIAMVNTLLYCGAGTGRFAGGGGFNIQNLHKGEHYGVDLRSLFIPREGKVFVISDLSQIEARVLLYLAGDTEQLGLIREGLSVYEAHARQTLGYTGKEELKKADPELYALAKSRVLGLGYGCGAERFRDLAESLAGVKLSQEEAQRQVDDYRRTNFRIVEFWRKLDDYLRLLRGQDMGIGLPSGRKLRYRDIRTEGSDWVGTVQGRRVKLYGGLLTENVVQATARDVFAEMLLKIAALPEATICFHVHDEVVVEVPEREGEEYREKINRIMSTTPAWLEGCPIAAETKVCDHYTK